MSNRLKRLISPDWDAIAGVLAAVSAGRPHPGDRPGISRAPRETGGCPPAARCAPLRSRMTSVGQRAVCRTLRQTAAPRHRESPGDQGAVPPGRGRAGAMDPGCRAQDQDVPECGEDGGAPLVQAREVGLGGTFPATYSWCRNTPNLRRSCTKSSVTLGCSPESAGKAVHFDFRRCD